MNNQKNVKLNNGIRVVLEYIPYVNSCAFGVWVRNGAVNEEKDYAGISHFIEHMVFKGTETRTAKEIAGDIDKIGGQMNAFTSNENTCFYVKCTSDHLYDAADVIIDMVNNPTFDAKEMTRERKVIEEEIKMVSDQPDSLAIDTIGEVVFKGTPLGNSVIGTNTSLRRITSPVIKKYKENAYTADSMVVSIAGNFDEEKVIEFLNSKFKEIKREKEQVSIENFKYKPNHKVIVKDIMQSHLCLGIESLKKEDDDFYVFSVLNNIMGGSMSSRLFQNIREEKGLAYSVFSNNTSFKDLGLFYIYAGVSHDKIKDCLMGIKEELEKLDSFGVTEEELSMAKEQFKASFVFSQENVAARMFSNGKSILMSNNPLSPEEVLKKINAIELSDIERVKKMITNFDNYSLVLVTNKKVNPKSLMK